MPRRTDLKTIMIIGSGPIVIGQGCEFDYSGTQACKALREEGYRIVLINSNPATIMTDPQMADRTYIEPITPEAVAKVLGGEVWTPPDVDLSGSMDEETSDMLGRLSTLTPQQVRVLMMLGEGLLNKQIAYKLSVSEATIKAHVSAILQKLGVDSRTQAVIAVNKIDNRDWQNASG